MHPATVLKAGPCVVAQVKTVETDGYEAVQLGLVEAKPTKENKPTQGHFKKAGVPPTRVRARGEACKAGGEPLKPGDQVNVVDLRRRRARRRHRHQPRQGLPGRRQAAPLRGRPRDARLDVPPRARIDWRLVVSRRASSRACGWAATWAPIASRCAT